MALDQLLVALEREARAAADQALARGRAEAAAITARAEAELARRREASSAAAIRAQCEAFERDLADAARQARRRTLEARDALLRRVEAALRAELPAAVIEPAYLATLPERVAAGLACFDADEPVTIRTPAALEADVRRAAGQRPGLRVEAADTVGHGVTIESADGALRIADTVEAAIEAGRADLARRTLRRLELVP